MRVLLRKGGGRLILEVIGIYTVEHSRGGRMLVDMTILDIIERSKTSYHFVDGIGQVVVRI